MKSQNDIILILEDNAGLLDLINESIDKSKYQTVCFQNASSAIDWLSCNKPNLMLLDYTLPDMSASEFLVTLKAKEITIPPFIVTTGQGDERIAVEMMKLGAKDYLVKDTNFLDKIPVIVSKLSLEIENENKIRLIEQNLEELNQFNKQIIECAHEGIIVLDNELKYKVWNPFMVKLTGLAANEVIGKIDIDVFPFLANTGVIECIKSAYNNNQTFEKEFHFDIPSTGKSGWVTVTIAPMYNSASEVIGVINTVHDITEKKQNEIALKENKVKLSVLFNDSPDAYLLLVDGVFTDCNRATENMLGGNRAQIIGKTPAGVSPEYQQDGSLSTEKATFLINEVLRLGNKTFEWTHKRFDGEVLQVEVTIVKINLQGITTLFTTWRNITKRKEAEKALIQTKQSYEDIINTVSEAIYVIDENGIYIDVNVGATKMYKCSKESLIGKPASNYAAPGLNDMNKVMTQMISVLQTGVAESFEFWAVRSNGEIFPKDIIVNRGIYFEKVVLILTARDITDRKAAQKEIDKINNHYKALIEKAPDGIVLLDAQGEFKFASPSARRMFGYKLTETLQDNPASLTHPDDSEMVQSHLAKLFEDSTYIPTLEYRFIDKNGNWKWVETTFTNLLADESVQSIVLNFREITERKASEAIIAQNNATLKSILESTTDSVFSVDSEYKYTGFNSAHADVIKQLYGADIKIGHNSLNDLTANDREVALQNYNAALNGQRVIKVIDLGNVNFKRSVFELIHNPIINVEGKSTGVSVFARDISDRIKAEEDLRESNEKFQRITENIDAIVWRYDLLNNKWVYVSPQSEKMLGYLPNEWTNLQWWKDKIHKIDQLWVNEYYSQNPELMTDHSMEYRVHRKDGEIVWLLDKIGVELVNGKPGFLFGVMLDITLKKQLEEAIRESESIYSNLVDRIPDGVYKSTAKGKFVDVNPAMVTMLGYNSKEELLAIDIKKDLYFKEEHRDPKVLNPNNEEKAIFQLKKKDGTGIWVEDHGWYNFDERGNKVTHEGVMRDITDRKVAEDALSDKLDELMRFQKLTVGRELAMIELKKEINAILLKIGQKEKYRIVE